MIKCDTKQHIQFILSYIKKVCLNHNKEIFLKDVIIKIKKKYILRLLDIIEVTFLL